MAKQKGLFPMQGTLGGVTFYTLNGKPIARMAGGGFNGEAIKHKPSMQRVRENGSEFGHCSRSNKAFRMAIRPFYEHFKFTSLHSHLMQLFTQLKDLDTLNPRGKRQVALGLQTNAGKALLKAFHYTPLCTLKTVLLFAPVFDASHFSLRYDAMAFSTLKFPKGATHLKLLYGVLDFDFETMQAQTYTANPVFMDADFTDSPLLLEPTQTPMVQHTGIAVLGMRLYQRMDGVLYPLEDERFVGFYVVGVV